MEDSILESEELNFEGGDDEIAFVRGGRVHKHIIPILLSPKVIFPFHFMRPIVSEPRLKELFRQSYEEKTVFGYLYHPADAEAKLPVIGQVGTSAQITKLDVTTNGSYLVEIAPLNRFYTDEYITDDESNLIARVKYYYDKSEDKELIKQLELEYRTLLKKTGELIGSKTWKNVFYEDSYALEFYLYASLRNHPKLTEPEKQYLLWTYKRSERLMFAISELSEMLPGVQRQVNRIKQPFKNN